MILQKAVKGIGICSLGILQLNEHVLPLYKPKSCMKEAFSWKLLVLHLGESKGLCPPPEFPSRLHQDVQSLVSDAG